MKPIITGILTIASLLFLSDCYKLNVFQEPPDHPVIDSIAPANGKIGTQIRLYGSGFSTNSSQNTVSVNGVLVRVDSPTTSTVVLATITAVTGTGHVNITVNNKKAEGPIFTYDDNTTGLKPVITKAYYKPYDERGTGFNVTNLPILDNGIKLLINRVPIPILKIIRAGSPGYNQDDGDQLLIDDGGIEDHVSLNFDSVVVIGNGIASDVFVYQLKPVVDSIQTKWGYFQFAAGDTLTISGNYFGDRSLPSSIYLLYNGAPLSPLPQIVTWNNKEIRAVMPAYDMLPVDAGANMPVKVGVKESIPFYVKYRGTVTATASLIAGGDQGYVDGTGSAAKFNNPTGIAVNALGTVLWVADQNNNRIRRITNITASGGQVTTYAGSTAGFYDGGRADAKFNQPFGIALDANSYLYIADYANNRIRKIDPYTNDVTTVAGDGSPSLFWYPTGVAVKNNVVYVADMNNNRIRGILNATVTTITGGVAGYADGRSLSAQFNHPYSLAMGADTSIYIADRDNHAIRKLTSGATVYTFAGGTLGKLDGTGTAAQFELPVGMAMDAQGNLYVTDSYNTHIRKISPNGKVSTITAAYDNGSGIVDFSSPSGIAVDAQGNIYITDAGTHRIYKITQ